ncbi:hypothetical protein [Paludifilum halophilum]|uniref:Uncharacterized protein n=1 Tax=Paludifilum halophilum TaxID=1642702 RepID=A0A235B3D6_9BACL|nr:hypothetical protein [Paludifilum halophilum]OYD06479.1 hypothetical protein CHM34_16450 [Paludifilum halophilum]
MTEEPQKQVNRLIDEAIHLLNDHTEVSPNAPLAVEHLQIARDQVNQKYRIESWGWSNDT